MKNRRLPLIIGLLLAIGTGVLLMTYLTSLRPAGTAGITKPVLVARVDIPARAATTSDLFTIEQRTANQIDSDAMTDPKALTGKYTVVAIPKGSVATTSKIGLASSMTLPAKVPIGMRAVSISIDNVKGVAGLITPGDRVDVIAVPPRAGNETPRGYAIIRGALILAMGADLQTTTAPAPGPMSAPQPSLTTVTLALTPRQVGLLAGADLNTTLRLALRNPSEPIRSLPPETLMLATQNTPATNTGPANAPIVMQGAAPAPVAAQPPAATVPAPAAGSPGVIVIDGDRVISGSAR